MDKSELITNLQISLDAAYEIAEANEQINETKQKIQDVENEVVVLEHSLGTVILSCFLWFIVSLIIFCACADFSANTFLVFVEGMALMFIPMIIFKKLIQKRGKNKAALLRAEKLPPLEQELSQRNENFEAVINSDEVAVLQKTVPQDYATIDAIEFMVTALMNLRADSLKEAINLYEEHLHRQEMLESQNQIIDLTQQNVAISQEMAANQQQILKNQQQQIKNQKKQIQTEAAILRKTKKVSRQARFSNVFTVVNTVHHWKR